MTTMTPKELSKEEVDALEKYCNERNPWEEFTLRCLILTIRQMEKKVFFAFEAGHYAVLTQGIQNKLYKGGMK